LTSALQGEYHFRFNVAAGAGESYSVAIVIRSANGHGIDRPCPYPASPCQPKKKCLDDGNKEGAMMDSAKALAATAAIRQMVEALPAEFQPKPTMQDAQRELKIIRENSPQSCKGKIGSASAWLDILFTPEKDRKFGSKDPQDTVLNILARIEAEIARGAR
jgi:hypothetical protein